MRGTARRLGTVRAVFVLLALSCTFTAIAHATGGGASSPTDVTVESHSVYTPTGITVQQGDTIEITASGRIHFGGGRIASMDPVGIPAGAQCQEIANSEPRRTSFPAKELACWSLIAKIADGAPIEIGDAHTFRADRSGELVLGLNDNFVPDNTGSWAAKVSVTQAASTSTTVLPATTSSKKSGTGIVLVVSAMVLVLAGALFFVAARRRKRRGATDAPDEQEPPAAPSETPAPEPSPVPPLFAETATGHEPEAAAVATVESAPPEPESIDVNIYDVEFSNGLTLRVGYNHFPEGVEVRWQVTQNRALATSGTFVTKGGGSTNHIETVPLGVKLQGRDTSPDGADVQFDWSINGVPFRYSVRRDPNC